MEKAFPGKGHMKPPEEGIHRGQRENGELKRIILGQISHHSEIPPDHFFTPEVSYLTKKISVCPKLVFPSRFPSMAPVIKISAPCIAKP
jgi:hypothetical protein